MSKLTKHQPLYDLDAVIVSREKGTPQESDTTSVKMGVRYRASLEDSKTVVCEPLSESKVVSRSRIRGTAVVVHHSLAPLRRNQAPKATQLRKKRKGQVSRGKLSLPPQIEVTPRLRQTFRFYSNGAINGRSILVKDLFGIAGGICSVVNSVVKTVASSLRIASISMYLPNGGQGEIGWVLDNTDQGPDEAYDCTIPANIAVSECIVTSPPLKSIGEDWINAAADMTDEVFRVSCSSSGAVIDVDLEYTLPNEFTATSITVATAVLGTFYYLALDDSNGTPTIVPLNRPTTT